jgi:hypothetical protein
VLGLEGTFTGTDLTGTGIAFADFGHEFNAKVNWLATVIGRVGVTIDHALVYAGGGVAFVRDTDAALHRAPAARPVQTSLKMIFKQVAPPITDWWSDNHLRPQSV